MPEAAMGSETLDAGERLSVDELRALQLKRLRATLQHAYDNVPFYRERSTGRRAPRRLPGAGRPGPVPVHRQGRPARQLPVRHVRRAAGAGAAHPRLVRHDRAARPSSATPSATIDTWADVMARSIRAAGGRPGHKVHNAYGYGLFTGGLGAHYGVERLGGTVIPASGGMTARQVQLIQDFRPEIIMVTPSYMLTMLDEFERQGIDPRPPRCRSASSAPSRGPSRCASRSRSAWTCTPSTSTGCPR